MERGKGMIDVKYCPHCGHLLSPQEVDRRKRPACAACGYVFWNAPIPVVAAIVERREKILLARKRAWPPGRWALFAGFPEAGETMEQAVLREVYEEASLKGEVLGLVGVYSLPRRNQVFIVYRLRAAGGEVNVGEELEAIREFRRDELPAVLEHLPPQAGAARALRDWLQMKAVAHGHPQPRTFGPPEAAATKDGDRRRGTACRPQGPISEAAASQVEEGAHIEDRPDEATIIEREDLLRAWFTRDADPVLEIIDGLDIGWGGVQRWATGQMPPLTAGRHLDFACGYGTFLAQLGWRFPAARLVGLNIDFAGPHAQIGTLLSQAGVGATLLQADARRMPFAGGAFASASCFLGLQDIEIGFGRAGLRTTLAEAARVLHPGGVLTLLDTFSFDQFDRLLEGLPLLVVKRGQRPLDVRWNRQVAERAIALYAEGWVAQARVDDPLAKQRVYREAHSRMREQMEEQLQEKGYYVPFEPIQLVIAKRIG